MLLSLTGVLGIGGIILGVVVMGVIGNSQSRNIKKGAVAAILSGIIFGSQLVPLKLGHLAPRDFFFSMSLGIVVVALVTFFIKKAKFEKKAIGLSAASGVIWNIGNLLSVTAISLVGLAKAVPITQSCTLIAVLWGVFYFKEIKKGRDKIQIIIGAIILLCGVAILSQA